MKRKQSDEQMKKLRERKSERRKALKKAHDSLEEATQLLLFKLKSTNGKKPLEEEEKTPEPKEATPEEQEA